MSFWKTLTNPASLFVKNSSMKDPLGLFAKKKPKEYEKAQIEQPYNMGQINTAYDQTQSGISAQSDFLNALRAQNGIANQANVYKSYQDLAQGVGPNLALQQLQNTTGQNIANQAALMAGQRGASANAGLLARQAAMQGGGLQQQAAGQAAELQAKQQLDALNAMGNIANQQVGAYGNATNAYNQAALQQQSNLLGAAGNYNQAQIGATGAQNQLNAAAAEAANKANAQKIGTIGKIGGTIVGGYFGGPAGAGAGGTAGQEAGNSFGRMFAANGGMVPGYAQGGAVGAQSMAGRYLCANGAYVGGQAKVPGDSIKNDTVPAMLSPGEIVIPRSVVKSEDPVRKSAKFVQAVLARNGMRK